MIRLAPFALLLPALLASACASPTYHLVALPDQSVEVTSPELSRIYVLRAGRTEGVLRGVHVFDGEQQIGSLNAEEFVCWERRPGHSLVTVVYEGPYIEGGSTEALLDLDTVAGGVYFFGITIDRRENLPRIEPIEPDIAREMLTVRQPSRQL